MNERPKSPDLRGPLHLARCAIDLGVMAVKEVIHKAKAALDDDPWPEDSPEDQAVHSDVFQRRNAS